MSDQNQSSISVNQPLPRDDENHQRQNDPQRQMIPMPNLRRISSTIARRTLVIPNRSDIVKVLLAISKTNRQAMNILSGRGYVAQANLFSLPSRLQMSCVGRRKILYLNGWIQHMVSVETLPIPSSVTGVLHVSLSHELERVAIATRLIATGTVEVDVMFSCGPGSAIQPDAPGRPRVPIRIPVNVNELAQAVQAQLAPVP